MTAPVIAIERVSKRFVRRPGLAERAAGLVTGGARAATGQARDDVTF
jgi:peptide/nickel transport system ATP-binding protein